MLPGKMYPYFKNVAKLKFMRWWVNHIKLINLKGGFLERLFILVLTVEIIRPAPQGTRLAAIPADPPQKQPTSDLAKLYLTSRFAWAAPACFCTDFAKALASMPPSAEQILVSFDLDNLEATDHCKTRVTKSCRGVGIAGASSGRPLQAGDQGRARAAPSRMLYLPHRYFVVSQARCIRTALPNTFAPMVE